MSGHLRISHHGWGGKDPIKGSDFAAIGRWIINNIIQVIFVDSGDLICPGMKGYTKRLWNICIEIVKRNIPNAKLRCKEKITQGIA